METFHSELKREILTIKPSYASLAREIQGQVTQGGTGGPTQGHQNSQQVPSVPAPVAPVPAAPATTVPTPAPVIQVPMDHEPSVQEAHGHGRAQGQAQFHGHGHVYGVQGPGGHGQTYSGAVGHGGFGQTYHLGPGQAYNGQGGQGHGQYGHGRQGHGQYGHGGQQGSRQRSRSVKRSRMDTSEEVFVNDGSTFSAPKPKRGFRGGRRNNDTVIGGDKSASFGAPISLFVANVRQDISVDTIKEFLVKKELMIVGIEKISHDEARNASFRVDIKTEDKEKALSGDIWPVGVRVREFRHFRQRGEKDKDRGGQFQ